VSELVAPVGVERARRGLATLAACVLLSACASTDVQTTGNPLTEGLCRVGAPALATAVVWGSQWRPDQKEPAPREAAALRGIQAFLADAHCLAVTGVHRLPSGAAPPSDADLLRLAAADQGHAERVVLIVVRELGPRLTVGSPMIVEGGTEVVIDVRVLDAKASTLLASTHTVWRNGGRFVIKGVASLEQDMSAALSATLMSATAAK
jgi:hypothetical protein